jgi:hypothetical protein
MNKLSFLDLFNKTPSLKINKSNSYHTIFGMTISIITLICITANFIYFTLTSFSRTNYQILERIDNKIIPTMELNKNKISFTLLNALGKEFSEPDRLFSIDAKFWEIIPQSKNGSFNEINTEIKNIPVKNCSIYKNGDFGNDFVNQEKRYPTSKCLDFSNFDKKLYGKYGSLKG